MKKLFLIISIFITLQSFAVTRFLVSGGDGNWNSTNNWSASTGGASGASFPVAGDSVIINTASSNAPVSVNVASACKSIAMTGTYTGTITLAADLTLTNILSTVASTWTGAFNINLLSLTNGGILTATGSRPTIVFTGKGTWSGNNNITLNITFNSSDTVTVSGSVRWGNTSATMKWLAGVVKTTSSTLQTSLGTFDVKQVTWNNVTQIAGGTNTLTTALNVGGDFTRSTGTGTYNGDSLKITGSATMGAGNINGTSIVVFNGTGTVAGSSSTGFVGMTIIFNTAGTITIGTNLSIGGCTLIYTTGTVTTTSSTLNMSGSNTMPSGITWNNLTTTGSNAATTVSTVLAFGGTLTLGATTNSFTQTVQPSSGAIITANATTTFVTLAITTVTFNGSNGFTATTVNSSGGTITISTAGDVFTTVNLSGSTTFAGTQGFSCSNLIDTRGNNTHTFVSTVTYTVSTLINIVSCTLKASTPGSQAILTLTNSATAVPTQMGNNSVTDMSNLGLTLFNPLGVLSNCSGWVTQGWQSVMGGF